MMITFLVYHESNNRGIKLQFSSDEASICRGDLNGNEGVIYTKPDHNMTDYSCEYERDKDKVISGAGKEGTIALYFKNLTAGYNSSVCDSVRLGIYVKGSSDESSDEQTLSTICSNETGKERTAVSPFPYISLSNQQSLKYGYLDFTMNYKIFACGGYHNYPGDITISNPKSIQDGNVDCAWFLRYEEGSTVSINITKLDLKMNCTEEYIIIYNGPSRNSPILNVLCNNNVPTDDLILQKNTVFIHYHRKSQATESKDSVFELKISSSDTCGGLFYQENKAFRSPFYGKNYAPNTECIWEIWSLPGTQIGLAFVDRFFIEDSENCTKDYVEAFDYYKSEWRSLGRRCGRHMPAPFNSTSEKMKVIFRTDASGNGDGFSAVWDQNCGGVFEVTSNLETLTSPGFPENYFPNLNCNYTFVAPSDSYFKIDFQQFSLETPSPRCSHDNVTIYTLPNYVFTEPPSQKVGIFCGTNGPPSQRVKGRATIIFQTNQYVHKQGFSMTYQLDRCGGTITAATMVISPPIIVSTDHFLGLRDCRWNITAPAGKIIVVKFESLSLGNTFECYSDYIELFNGSEVDSSQRLVKICGSARKIIKPIVIGSNKAILLWRTDQNSADIGFSAAVYFRPKCDEKIEITSDQPYVLDLSNRIFSESMECTYKIVGEPLSSIKMTFTSINLSICDPDKNLGRCDCDYVEVLDGNGPFSRVIGERYCGYDLPKVADITSTGSALYVRFVTDSIRPSTGFTATFTVVPSLCSSLPYVNIIGNETVPTYFTSPAKPGSVNYPPNILCTWIVEAPEGMILDIQFHKFELEQSVNCENDSLTIEDDKIKEYVTEGLGDELIFWGGSTSLLEPTFYEGIIGPKAPHVYCGSKLPHDYISESNKIRIHFKTNSENEFRGINFTIRALRACTRNFTALTGRLLWSHEMYDCKTTIKVPENHTISLFFHRFWFVNSDCTKNFLKVYDGTFDSGVPPKIVCGYSAPEPIFSTQNQLSLYFHFGEDNEYHYSKGFYDILYVATNQSRGCGGEIFNYGGLFSSPMYPNPERTSYDCTWIVTVPQNLKVALRFSGELKTFHVKCLEIQKQIHSIE